MVKKTIQRLTWATPEQQRRALALINRTADPREYQSVQNMSPLHFPPPSPIVSILRALNEVLDTHGVEPLWVNEEVRAEYLNVGDAYAATIIYRYDIARWQVWCWGDLVEMWERQGLTVK